MFYRLSKYLNNSLSYNIVERALRSGDIIFYNYQGNEKNIQRSIGPIERKLVQASRGSQFCSLLPWLACMVDDRNANESEEQNFIENDVANAEAEMIHTWNVWQHATLIVVMLDETQESNPTRNPKKTLPYVFVPNSKNRLNLIPLRNLLAQSKTQLFAVRHLLINDSEATPVNVDNHNSVINDNNQLGAQSFSPKLLSATQTMKLLSSNTRSCIHSGIVEFFTSLFNAHENDGTESFTKAQILSLLLSEPSRLTMDKQGVFSTHNSAITASQAYLTEIFTPTTQSFVDSKVQISNSELMPLFIASPAFLTFYTLYIARVTRLLPKPYHNTSHLRDTGIIDRFLMPGYSFSDEVVVHFDQPSPQRSATNTTMTAESLVKSITT